MELKTWTGDLLRRDCYDLTRVARLYKRIVLDQCDQEISCETVNGIERQ